MQSELTLYEILQVAEQADPDSLKKAYRRQAQRLHPDRHPNDQDAVFKFQKLQEAYKILSNPMTRSHYNLTLREKYKEQEATFTQETPSQAPEEGLLDTVKNWFKKPRTEWDSHGPGGYHIHVKMPLSINEAWTGTYKNFDVRVAEICFYCHGRKKNCSYCHGTGQIFFNHRYRLEIPKGAKPQQILRLFEKGHSGPFTESSGDILVRLDFQLPYPWKFEDEKLIRPFFLTEIQSDMGGQFSLKSIDGSTGSLNLPGFLKNGQKVRLKNQGWITESGEREDAWLVILLKSKTTPAE